MSEYLMEFKTNKAYMEMNIQEGSTIPNYLVFVCLNDKGLTKDSKLDATLGDETKTYSECFYITTINKKDYAAVGRKEVNSLCHPTGNYECLPDEVFEAWVVFFGASAFYAPQDLPQDEVI